MKNKTNGLIATIIISVVLLAVAFFFLYQPAGNERAGETDTVIYATEKPLISPESSTALSENSLDDDSVSTGESIFDSNWSKSMNDAVPASTAAPTATPKPARTAAPTATPKPARTAAPTAMPKPAGTAAPTATPKPASTAAPTATPKPAGTATPTATPSPAAPTPTQPPKPSPSPSASPVDAEAWSPSF